MAIKRKDNFYTKILNKYLLKILAALNIEYKASSMLTIKIARGDGKKTSMKPLNPSKQEESILFGQISKDIVGVTEFISDKINKAINDGILNKKSNPQVAKDIQSIFDESGDDYYNYKNRMLTIARTESTNVLTQSADRTARSLGATGKYLSVINDNLTSQICKAMSVEYGDSDKSIKLNKNFKVTVKVGKRIVIIDKALPSFHPNCRTMALYLFN